MPWYPLKHTSQLRQWIEVEAAPTTTYNITAVEIAALTLSEIAGNAIVSTLLDMPTANGEWYRDSGIDLQSLESI